ncbi:CPBP family intramembrane glutamic endopeptidase [Cellulophaga sp. Hel_I_12]|uniref:CPBP family intramembrane glutamic endopeptidase n=1 Tax=Cellulophaga sp. Hel_I_12 TaxID=1249972 RepID=UPI000646DF51|nr:CPBP family intramembrane glutamic endopeptidase [Cellulophaga sp. Hel_I_12]
MVKKHKLFYSFLLLLLLIQILHGLVLYGTYLLKNITYETQTIILVYSFHLLFFLGILFCFKWLKLKWTFKFETISYKTLAVVASLFFAIFLAQNTIDYDFIKSLFDSKLKIISFNLDFDSKDIWILFLMIIAGPILEEIMYRYIIFTALLERYNLIISLVLSSFLFAIMHLNLNGLIAYFFIGIFFGYVYYITKSLWLNIAIHMVWNFLTQITKIEYINFSDQSFILYFSLYILSFGLILWGFKNLRISTTEED